MQKLMMALVAAVLATPVAASTVGNFSSGSLFSPDSVGTLSNGGTQWNFGVPVSGHRHETFYRSQFSQPMNGGRSTVNLTGSDACETVAAGAECLVGTITYTNRVNVGSGPGPDRATASFSGTQYNFNIAFDIAVDRSTNQQPTSCLRNTFGCADQWYVAFTSPISQFRIEGSGGFVHEENSGDIRIFWTRPAAPPPPPEVVPLPASIWLLGAGVAGLAVARRRRRG